MLLVERIEKVYEKDVPYNIFVVSCCHIFNIKYRKSILSQTCFFSYFLRLILLILSLLIRFLRKSTIFLQISFQDLRSVGLVRLKSSKVSTEKKTHKAVFQRESGKVKALNLRIALTTPLRGHYRFPQFYLKASLASSNKLPRLKCVFLQIVLYIMYTIRSGKTFAEKRLKIKDQD